MAPFPETEIMTIKRLEVALRKQDFKLLKDGAYKLHEKYHAGFKFEYLDLLKDILSTIENTDSIPRDIKDILVPTIEDILSCSSSDNETETQPQEQNRVSSLTSLSYSTKQENSTKLQVEMQKNTQSPFSAQPFKEFSTPKVVVNETVVEEASEVVNNEPKEEMVEPKIEQFAIFYNEKTSNQTRPNAQTPVKELLLGAYSSNLSLLKWVLECLGEKESEINIITNSKNPELSLIEKAKLVPLYGLLNFFKCQTCDNTYLNSHLDIAPLALQCPKCSSVMLLDNEFSLENYNLASVSLVESNIWVIVNPNTEDKVTFDMLKTTLRINKAIDEIFILDDNINNVQHVKDVLLTIKPDLKIGTRGDFEKEFCNRGY